MSIVADLHAISEKMLKETGYRPMELHVNSKTLIEMYRQGFLTPGDGSIKIFVTDGKIEDVEAYLREIE